MKIQLIKNKKALITISVIIVVFCLFVILKFCSITQITIDNNKAVIVINFLIPMNQQDVEQSLEIESEVPLSNFCYTYKWIDNHTLYLKIEEMKSPLGQQILLKMHSLPSKIGIHKNFSKTLQFKCIPELDNSQSMQYISTDGPFILEFNTNIDKKQDIKKYIQSDFDYYVKSKLNKIQVIPAKPLQNEVSYKLNINKGIKGKNGLSSNKNYSIKLNTVKKPLITSVYPTHNSTEINIYPQVACESNEIIKKASVSFQGNSGKVLIKENKMVFYPDNLLKPNTKYKMRIQVTNIYNEKSLPKEVTFETMPIDKETMWVEVVLGDKQEVIVRKGEKTINTMFCSGGTKEEPTLIGTFYLRDRGKSFFSQRFQEGALYWVRITKQYLFHSIPRDKEGNIIESELKKIGTPASHGCIRLKDEDAKWFYENVPHNTMVIIHN